MKDSSYKILNNLIIRYPALNCCIGDIAASAEAITDCYRNNGKVLTCGNGGSAADALHIVGELMKSFICPRPIPADIKSKITSDHIARNLQGALPAIALVSEIALETAYANDASPDLSFAQQVYGYGNKNDVLIGISTSGNSKNILYAAEVAHIKDIKVIALTGGTGGLLAELADISVIAPETETYKIQEYHLPIYHALCMSVENEFFG